MDKEAIRQKVNVNSTNLAERAAIENSGQPERFFQSASHDGRICHAAAPLIPRVEDEPARPLIPHGGANLDVPDFDPRGWVHRGHLADRESRKYGSFRMLTGDEHPVRSRYSPYKPRRIHEPVGVSNPLGVRYGSLPTVDEERSREEEKDRSSGSGMPRKNSVDEEDGEDRNKYEQG